MAEGVARGFVVAAQKIDIKNVFPRPAAHGARFDLTQADIAQREHAEGLEQCAGDVLDFKSDGSLVGAVRNEMLIGAASPSPPAVVSGFRL